MQTNQQIRARAEGRASRAVSRKVRVSVDSHVWRSTEYRLPLSHLRRVPGEINVCACYRLFGSEEPR